MEPGGNSNRSKRILYIDNLRWFGIVLVYLGHFLDKLIPSGNLVFLWLHNVIYSFHMPLFFLLSGVFWQPEKISARYLIRRAIILLVPALFWSIVYIPFSLSTISKEDFFNTLAKYPFGHFDFFPASWFLVCLFMVELILAGSSRILKYQNSIYPQLILIGTAFVIGFVIDENQSIFQKVLNSEVSFWYIGEAFMAIGFFLTGSSLKGLLTKVRKRGVSLLMVLLITTASFIFIIFWIVGPWVMEGIYIDMSRRQYGNYFWFIAMAYLGIACSILLFRTLHIKSRLLRFVGENSIVFYLFNGLNIFVLDNLVLAMGWVPEGTVPAILFSIGYGIASQLVFVPLVYLLVRYAPLLVGRHKFSNVSPA